jgi:hypothetical protein
MSIIPGRFVYRIPQRMAADCSYLHSSTAFTTVRSPYCSADGSGLLILPLVNGFHNGSRAVLRSGWQRIAHSSARQRLSQRFARRFAQRMAADCSFFRSSTAFATLCAPYYSADGSADSITARLWVHLFLPLVDDFANVLGAVDCSPYRSFVRSSAASTRVYMPDCSADSSADRRFFGSLTAIFSPRFAYRIARRMARRIAHYCRSLTPV